MLSKNRYKLKGSGVDVKGKLRKLVINQFYNTKFKKKMNYRLVQSFIICRYNLCSHKKGKFYPTPINRSLLYTPIACTTTYNNLIWDEFETFYALINYLQQLESYAFETCLNLSYFLES
jgi:hypothetical protein